MDSRNTLLFKKGENAVVNSFAQWGIGCCKVPFKAGGKTKDLPKRDWHDEHGEDPYIPKKLMMEAYDAEFELACVVNSQTFNLSAAFEKITAFKMWLTGNDDLTNHPEGTGAEYSIYSPYSTIGRQGCYLLEISDEEPHLQLKGAAGNVYNENVLTFKVKFRVTDPLTPITLQ